MLAAVPQPGCSPFRCTWVFQVSCSHSSDDHQDALSRFCLLQTAATLTWGWLLPQSLQSSRLKHSITTVKTGGLWALFHHSDISWKYSMGLLFRNLALYPLPPCYNIWWVLCWKEIQLLQDNLPWRIWWHFYSIKFKAGRQSLVWMFWEIHFISPKAQSLE